MAVYTHISKEHLDSILKKYDIGSQIKLTPINSGIENTNYLLKTSIDSYILTIFEEHISSEELPYFIALLILLKNKNIKSPEPIKNRKQGYISYYKNKPLAIFSFLKGTPPLLINQDLCYQIGTYVAHIHLATKDFSRKRLNKLGKDHWIKSIKIILSKKPIIKNIDYNLLQNISEFIDINWPIDLPKGTIHGDVFPDNVFCRNKKISAIIDFYFACYEYYIYDLSIIIISWCFENNVLSIDKVRSLLEGYNKVRTLEKKETDIINLLCLGSSLRFFLTRLEKTSSSNNIVYKKDPFEYYNKMIYFINNMEVKY